MLDFIISSLIHEEAQSKPSSVPYGVAFFSANFNYSVFIGSAKTLHFN